MHLCALRGRPKLSFIHHITGEDDICANFVVGMISMQRSKVTSLTLHLSLYQWSPNLFSIILFSYSDSTQFCNQRFYFFFFRLSVDICGWSVYHFTDCDMCISPFVSPIRRTPCTFMRVWTYSRGRHSFPFPTRDPANAQSYYVQSSTHPVYYRRQIYVQLIGYFAPNEVGSNLNIYFLNECV